MGTIYHFHQMEMDAATMNPSTLLDDGIAVRKYRFYSAVNGVEDVSTGGQRLGCKAIFEVLWNSDVFVQNDCG
jgi:hypothetical protein